MDSGLKQRLIGAAVLVALAVIFLPMLVKGPAPDSGVADMPLEMPDEPKDGYVTRELPLLPPGEAPEGGAVGMPTPAGEQDRLPTVDTATAHPDAAELADADAPATGVDAQADQEAQPDAAAAEADAPAAAPLPATVAGGDYAVHFGSYGSAADAGTVVERLRKENLPARSTEVEASGRKVWRVHIGPYATRAQAEAVRVRAARIGSNDARVVALDATPAPPARQQAAAAAAPRPEPPAAPATQPAAPDVGFVVQLGAFSNAADAGALRDRVRGAGFTAFTDTVNTDKGVLTRVKAGPVVSRAEAERLKSQVQGKTGVSGMVRSHP